MKSLFLKALVAAAALSPAAYSLSLYDMAPPIGLPESHAVKYTVNVSAGYDDNLNSAHVHKRSGEYVRFGIGATYADYESICKLNYHAHLGGQLYNKTAYGTDQRLFSDISAGMTMSRSVGAGSSVSLNANVSYRPEPDYANGISASRAQGDCLNWSVSLAYSQAIDTRWSWTLSASTSGNIYTEGDYKIDNRQYVSGSAALNYRATTRTSYSLSSSYRYDFREHGYNSNNVYLHGTVNHSIDPVSSCNLSIGTQFKAIAGETRFYPSIRGGYNRKMASGLTLHCYVSLDNENVNTYGRYKGVSFNYLSDATWRVGCDASYSFTHVLSGHVGGSLLATKYSRGTQGMPDLDRKTWSLNCGLTYRYSKDISFNVNYMYTHSTGSQNFGYDRNTVFAGVSYTF